MTVATPLAERAVIKFCPCGDEHVIPVSSIGWSVKCLKARREFSIRVAELLPCNCSDTWHSESICFAHMKEDEARGDGRARFHCGECRGRGDIRVSGGPSKDDPLNDDAPEVRRPCEPCGASGLVWGDWLGW